MKTTSTIACLALSLVAATLLGCDGDEERSGTNEAQRTLSRDDLRRYPPGSPERAALEWWRDLQFQNAGGAHERYAEDAAPPLEDLARQVSIAASSFVGIPEIVDVSKDGELATVYMQISPPGSSAPPRNLSVNLVEDDGEWLIRDNLLVEQAVNRVARIRAQQQDSEPE
ncbi:MAG TPA: hypothetical protein VIL04_13575 [Solirubrobacterales bacterium]|jgi:hypothetical protein